MSDQILPHDLPHALDRAPDSVRMLSLDCFDTLIWRNVHKPSDLFCDLAGGGTSRQQRMWAESAARTRASLKERRNEATIEEIYAALLPSASDEERQAYLARELEAEAQHCYAFEPTAALIREAKEKGLEVAIVSDTYLSEAQLRDLIEAAAGPELLGLIDHVFCSSVYGAGKCETLFEHVLKETGLKPAEIFHIGDNPKADLHGAARYEIPALHLLQFDEDVQAQLRLEAAAAAILDGSGPHDRPSVQPHRAALAAALPQIDDEAERLGYAALGPVLHGFAEWVADEARERSEASDGRTHILFMLRDGYLPHRVFDCLPDTGCPSAALEISRFTGVAASLTTESAVLAYVESEVPGMDFRTIAKQLLLKPGEVEAICKKLPAEKEKAQRAFVSAVKSQRTVAKIISRAEAFAERLIAYVRREIDPQPGDTLMLVDLGYHGTVQDHVESVLKAAFAVDVAGRYLLLREHTLSGCDKRGFIGPDHYGADTLQALAGNVAVLEQLCTITCGSVIDYEEDGSPVRRKSGIKGRQSAVRDRVQSGCIRYASEGDSFVVRRAARDTVANRRRAAVASLGRLMFLPQPRELAVLSDFEHDVNLGTDSLVGLFDPAVAQSGLRRRGLFYLKDAERMYLPAELRGRGLPLSLSLMTQRRFGLDLRFADFCDRSIELPIIVADGTNVWADTITAYPTDDGYFTVAVPVGASRFAIGLQFGKLYDWVQVESAEFVGAEDFLKPRAKTYDALPTLEGMEQVAPHLMRCDSQASFMMVPPPQNTGGRELLLTVTFRPIAEREGAVRPAASNETGIEKVA